MNDIKLVIAQNIIELRKANKMTQAELAEKLSYSDKAVSKWERGESVPDVSVLKEIADLFSVTVDYLLNEEHGEADMPLVAFTPIVKKNRLMITLLSTALVWLIATVLYVFFEGIPNNLSCEWMTFVYSVPVSFIVLLVFNNIWGKKRRNYLIISLLVWSVLAAIYLSLLMFDSNNFYLVFIIGIPAQIIILLWSGMRKNETDNC
ncbi:MAG: helix-turn-helix transcriptional regulator [Clostridia bacterium]|nr:helix-turn-helix transcriptional regulator [Clostridia bacterium]